MGSRTHIGNLQSNLVVEGGVNNTSMPVEANLEWLRWAAAGSQAGPCQVWAQRLEFVGLPGDAVKLQREIPSVVQNAIAESDGLIGCLALFSEQEGRLVTVITLWRDAVRSNQDGEVTNRLKRLLEPYVDRWLRSSKLVAFLLCPCVSRTETGG